ncbi:MAG: exodeoxyribonuclease VII small subunit [bacterium]|nr:exodeoxyribonuclease VII small subunit [bacterium]
MSKKQTIQESLKKLEETAAWFEQGEELDVEEGLKKVKEGATLIKELKIRLKDAENEFEEIKRELESDE